MHHKTPNLVVLLSGLCASASLVASPGMIATTLSPGGPVQVGDTFSVTLRISGYTDTNEIDGFNLNVNYPSALFSFVAGSFDPGAASGPDQQWLSKPNQESTADGYTLADFSDGSTPGTVAVSLLDLGFSSTERGTVAGSGFLVSFKLSAIAIGTGSITPAAYPDGTVLFDTELAPAGMSIFTGASITATSPPPPTIVCPADITIWTCATSAPVSFTVTATNHCGTNVTVTCVPASGSLFAVGTTTVTCTATDSCGNTSSCSFLVRVIKDTTPPVITCAPDAINEWITGTVPIFGNPTVSDDCDTNVTLTFVDAQIPATCPAVRVFRRTWTATDDCTNSASCSQTITFIDTTPPIIGCQPDRTNELIFPVPVSVFSDPIVTDACDTNVTVTFVTVELPAICPAVRIFRRTWTATDDCTNSAACSQTITFVDTTPPEILCRPDRTNEWFVGSVPLFFDPIVTDFPDTNVTVTFVDVELSATCPAVRIFRRTWMATDGCTNSAVCSQTITFVDTTPPVIICPTNITVSTCSNNAQVFYDVAATDNCDTNVTVTCGPLASGSFFPVGTTIVTCTAQDDCGNSNSCSFVVNVVPDTEPPRIFCPTNMSVVCTGTNGAQVFFSATVADNCDTNLEVTCTPPSASFFTVGTNTVICVAADDSGNTNSCSFTVTVTDPIPAGLTIQQQGTNVVICWPLTCTRYVLEETASLNGPITWMPVSAPVSVVGSQYCVTVAIGSGNRFFRLRGL